MVTYEKIECCLKQATELYNQYIEKSTATFHTDKLTQSEFLDMVRNTDAYYESYCILYDGIFTGYMYYSPFNPRQAYRRTVEITIYLLPEYHKMGIAEKALSFIEDRARKKGVQNMIAKITAENITSIRFFEKNGYELAGILKDVGEKFKRVLSVAIYQKSLVIKKDQTIDDQD